MEVREGFPHVLVEEDEAEDAEEEDEVDFALDAQGHPRPLGLVAFLLAAVGYRIPDVVDGKEGDDGEGPVGSELEGPEEVHPLEETEKERRVA